MAIVVPGFGDEIRAEEFGTPVGRMVNSFGAVRRIPIAGVTVAAGATQTIMTSSPNVAANPDIACMLGFLTVAYTTTGAAELLATAVSVIGMAPAAQNGAVTVAVIFPRNVNVIPINIAVMAGAQPVVIDGTKSSLTVMSMQTIVTGTAFP